MAFQAWNILMPAIKLKLGIVVIKPYGLPVAGIMTRGTISFPVQFKLPEMVVCMTGRTILRQPLKILSQNSIFTLFEMT